MPTTIPYDPSLVLGNSVEKSRIEQLQKNADAQKSMHNIQDKLNSLILQSLVWILTPKKQLQT